LKTRLTNSPTQNKIFIVKMNRKYGKDSKGTRVWWFLSAPRYTFLTALSGHLNAQGYYVNGSFYESYDLPTVY
jgi:hypothetical protein